MTRSPATPTTGNVKHAVPAFNAARLASTASSHVQQATSALQKVIICSGGPLPSYEGFEHDTRHTRCTAASHRTADSSVLAKPIGARNHRHSIERRRQSVRDGCSGQRSEIREFGPLPVAWQNSAAVHQRWRAQGRRSSQCRPYRREGAGKSLDGARNLEKRRAGADHLVTRFPLGWIAPTAVAGSVAAAWW